MGIKRDRPMKQIESPEIIPHMYGQLIFEDRAQISNGERTVSSIYTTRKPGYSHAKE